MLKEIAIITIAVANPADVERAWNAEFGYTTVDNGNVSTQLAQLWSAPEMAGDTYITMAPANEAETFVRLVQDDSAVNYAAMTSHGWNATDGHTLRHKQHEKCACHNDPAVRFAVGKNRHSFTCHETPGPKRPATSPEARTAAIRHA